MRGIHADVAASFHNAVIAQGWEDPDFAAALATRKAEVLAEFARKEGFGDFTPDMFEGFALPDNPVGPVGQEHREVLEGGAAAFRQFDPLVAGPSTVFECTYLCTPSWLGYPICVEGPTYNCSAGCPSASCTQGCPESTGCPTWFGCGP